jgi:hypothetical protein
MSNTPAKRRQLIAPWLGLMSGTRALDAGEGVLGLGFWQMAAGSGGSADVTAPTLSSLSPSDNAVGVAVNDSLVATFSESVQFGATVSIGLFLADDTPVEVWDQTDIGAGISISGAALTINPAAPLAQNQAHYVTISAGSVEDLAANDFAGLAEGEWSFTSVSVPVWVTASGANSADMEIDFVGNQAWLTPNEVAPSALLSCARASQKWVRNSALTLTNFANNALPYTDLGVLPEAAATNVCFQSQTMNTTNWTGSNIVSTDNAHTAPDGTTTAELFTDANTTTSVQVHIGRSVTVSGAGTHTVSVFARPGTITKLRITTVSFDAAGNGETYFDLVGAGSVSLLSAQHANARIRAYADGWYRCSVSFTTTTDLVGTVRFAMATANTLTVSSNGTLTMHLWQAQVESGSRASSIIPTTTASVTRPADIITFSDLTWFSGATDSFYAEWLARNVANAVVWAWDATNDKALDEQTGMSPRLAGATVANTTAEALAAKVAGRMAVNDFALCMAGGTVATDTSETAPGALTASRLGCDLAGANHLGDFISRVASFKVAIVDADLQTLSDP